MTYLIRWIGLRRMKDGDIDLHSSIVGSNKWGCVFVKIPPPHFRSRRRRRNESDKEVDKD